MRIFLSHYRGRVFNCVSAIVIALVWPPGLQAEPVSINEVIQIVSGRQDVTDLRLRSLTQTSNAISAAISSPAKRATHNESNAKPLITDSLFSGVLFQADQKPSNVVVITQGNVEGTICDCGEILVAGGGFPKWPLLFLGAIPFFFIDTDSPVVAAAVLPTPSPAVTPTPPSTSAIPEPASLILFGPALLALVARFRRYNAKMKHAGSAELTKGS